MGYGVAAGPSTPLATRGGLAIPTGNNSRTLWRTTMMTFDGDFLSLVEGSGLAHAGIVYVRQAGRDIGDVVKAVDAHLETRAKDDRGIHYC